MSALATAGWVLLGVVVYMAIGAGVALGIYNSSPKEDRDHDHARACASIGLAWGIMPIVLGVSWLVERMTRRGS